MLQSAASWAKALIMSNNDPISATLSHGGHDSSAGTNNSTNLASAASSFFLDTPLDTTSTGGPSLARQLMDQFAHLQASGRRSERQVVKRTKTDFTPPKYEDVIPVESDDEGEVRVVTTAPVKRKRSSSDESARKKARAVKETDGETGTSLKTTTKAAPANRRKSAAPKHKTGQSSTTVIGDDSDDTIIITRRRFQGLQHQTAMDEDSSVGSLSEIDDDGLKKLEQVYLAIHPATKSKARSVSKLQPIAKRPATKLKAETKRATKESAPTGRNTRKVWKKKVTLKIETSKLKAELERPKPTAESKRGRGASRKARAVPEDGYLDNFLEEYSDRNEAPSTKNKLAIKRPIGLKASTKSKAKTNSGVTPRLAFDADTGLLTPPDSQIHTPLVESKQDSSLVSLEHVDPKLVNLSRKLTARQEVALKAEPSGSPLVWAHSRQALCETVPYFKKPQGGCHSNDGHVYSFLYDGVGHCREYMDTDVIISRAGGAMGPDGKTGLMVQTKNQFLTDSQEVSVQNDILLQNPLVVISGDKNACALIKMPHRYCVLGWYKPVEMWQEKTLGKEIKEKAPGKDSKEKTPAKSKVWATVKYRFERLNQKEPAWYSPQAPIDVEAAPIAPLQLFEKTCTCGKTFSQVYLIGWMCLNANCELFWKLPDGLDAPYGILDYNPAFLQKRTPWANEKEPFSVKVKPPNIGNAIGDHLTYINTRGICCPKCGRCNSRYMFKGWKCDSPTCDWELAAPTNRPMLPAQLHSPWDSIGNGPSLARNKHGSSVKVDVKHMFGYKVCTYTFEGIKGTFVHAIANTKIVAEKDGPNDMLIALQTEDIGLERRRFSSKKFSSIKQTPEGGLATEEGSEDAPPKKSDLDDGDFMTAFSMNYGMPYKFVATGASRSFNDAPSSVRATRSRLNWAARTFLQTRTEPDSEPVSFNEQLIFAYLEQQKIEYHDDGEEGLGPCIATLSLGGRAKMHMRMKMKHYMGCSNSGILTAERPVPGGIGGPEMDIERLRAWEELQALKEGNRPLYQKRIKEIPGELGLNEKRKKADDLVTLTLSHGDIVLMDGYEIQKYLEHKVVPEGYLRFALTCRTVLQGHLKPEERPTYEVGEDDYGYDGSHIGE